MLHFPIADPLIPNNYYMYVTMIAFRLSCVVLASAY